VQNFLVSRAEEALTAIAAMTAAIAGATPKWLTSRVAISAATDVLLIPKALTFPADPQVSSIAALASAIAEQARATGEGDADDQKAANILAEGAMEGALLAPCGVGAANTAVTGRVTNLRSVHLGRAHHLLERVDDSGPRR
jgi:hypothetical protein